MNVLFICNQNLHRSKTAEELFRSSFATRSAGLYNERPVAQRDLVWADIIVVMEEAQREELARRFPQECMEKRVLNLDIPDMYRYMQPELVSVLKERVSRILEPFLE
ncbi:MAG: phosphotyrosine protein phosphatase [Nanoarchaeota archaeon]